MQGSGPPTGGRCFAGGGGQAPALQGTAALPPAAGDKPQPYRTAALPPAGWGWAPAVQGAALPPAVHLDGGYCMEGRYSFSMSRSEA